MAQNPFLNLSSHMERKTALELCVGFYQFFYYPDIDLDILKHITWEDIYQLYNPKSTVSQELADFPRLIDILKYIRLSHNSYLQLIEKDKDDDNPHSLADYISFREYDNLSENALSYLQNEFKNMSTLDFYNDSISVPTDICYPLQYLNVFFYNDSLQFLNNKKPEESLSKGDSRSLNTLTCGLEKYNLIEFKTDILKKSFPGSKAEYFIPKCSILSLTFVLLAFDNKEIPIEFRYKILSDFIINVCVANNCKPYEVLTYISKVKHGFSPDTVVKSRYEMFSNYQKKIKESIKDIEKKPKHSQGMNQLMAN